jgi:hypothetical protein
MALVEQDFTVEQGSSFIMEFDLLKDDNTALSLVTPSPDGVNTFQLGKYSFRMNFRKSKYRGTSAYGISENSVIQVGDEDTEGRTADGFYLIANHPGRVRMVIKPSSTASIKHGKYFFDIEAVAGTTGFQEVTKVVAGRFEVTAEATT